MAAVNDTEGKPLRTIEGNLLALDSAGNLVLDTSGRMDVSPAQGFPGLLGKGIPYNFAISAAAGTPGSGICIVTFQLQDSRGNAIASVYSAQIYLSDSSVGNGLTATTASGGLAAVATFGTILGAPTASKYLDVLTNPAGIFELQITDTAKTHFYPCAVVSNFGVQVGPQLLTANYG